MMDQFHQSAFSSIGNSGSKLRTYALIKTEIGIEKYLIEMKNCELRIKFTKFRLSNHNLMIEKGRHMGLKSEERICPFCSNVIEDEIHFFLECHAYITIREPLIREAKILNYYFQFLGREQKFKHLLSNFSWDVIADVIYKSFQVRDFFLSFPKRLD